MQGDHRYDVVVYEMFSGRGGCDTGSFGCWHYQHVICMTTHIMLLLLLLLLSMLIGRRMGTLWRRRRRVRLSALPGLSRHCWHLHGCLSPALMGAIRTCTVPSKPVPTRPTLLSPALSPPSSPLMPSFGSATVVWMPRLTPRHPLRHRS